MSDADPMKRGEFQFAARLKRFFAGSDSSSFSYGICPEAAVSTFGFCWYE